MECMKAGISKILVIFIKLLECPCITSGTLIFNIINHIFHSLSQKNEHFPIWEKVPDGAFLSTLVFVNYLLLALNYKIFYNCFLPSVDIYISLLEMGSLYFLLWQSIGGAGKDSIGDILDDFIRQRFGPDSYERVDSGLIMSKKLSALSKFNDKAKGRFVFLIENRACLPSIKLSSVDAVVIFNSDWNPFNDLRALQRIHFESQFEHVKVFRLYSSCTVEEKVLIFAKQDMILDSNIQSISPINSHLLLSWGAFHLFNELDKFHQHDTLYDYSENSIEKCFLNDSMLKFQNDVMVELVKELSGKAESNFCECLLLIKAQQSGSSYSRNISLVGERDGICSLDKDPPSFWLNLLEKRYPKWRFISETSQRIRRKVQHFEESFKVSEVENDEVRKKRRKLTTNTVDPICLQTWLEDKTKGLNKESEAHDDISHSVGQPASVSSATTLPFPVNMTKEPGRAYLFEEY